MKSINPFTGAIIKEYKEMSEAEIKEAIAKTQKAFLKWRKTDFQTRARLMKNAAEILRKNAENYGKLITEEMGKIYRESVAEVNKCAWVCDYYAENAEKFLSDEIIETDASKSFVSFQPLGIVLAIMPWNFPFWQVFRFAAPALMAGNVGILKHASNVPGCALAIEDIFRKAGFPENVFKSFLIKSDKINFVIENPLVKAATLTGSTEAGKAVAEKAGKLLKKTVLELGGSDAYIILKDADLEKTVDICITSKLINSGQSCIAAKRFIVVEEIKEKFESLLLQKMAVQKSGNPMNDDTNIGPLARKDLRDELHRQVVQSIEQGAVCLLGGQIPDTDGNFYPATVLTNVTENMPAYSEELFGPVAVIIPAKDEKDAIRIANDSVFGLGAAIFTSDIEKGERLAAEEIEAGCCFVNDFVRSDPRLPFGGVKSSGYGRELSHYGIKEFVNIKTVYIK
ncbi:MAG: succinate-semialdehyde dehydrogenase [Candidatus Cloacimonas sp. 4484_275]|nr:MAG: succinate-semialdehyde dehydrogenase [Candidatus Cloacimonas sp. 4484_275]